MEILTTLKISELEELITKAVERVLDSQLKNEEPLPDKVGIEVACEITGFLKSTIYKKTFNGEIPCSRMGKRLVFSREELLIWMQSQTIRKQSHAEISSQHLQVEANRKEGRKKTRSKIENDASQNLKMGRAEK